MGGSVLILKFMEKAPWLVLVGAALLAGIAGRIILDDKWLKSHFEPTPVVAWALVLGIAAAMTIAAVWWRKRRDKQQ